ncbi:MAG: DUF2934 domain-containing protein [Verrucomicrobia bacterium]|jgi:hypothetical protein|nr:DUF2934 domain-containing protein [Verrucomicrobiota bacterium]
MMKARLSHTIPEPTEAEIQHAAYLLWVESGKLPGRDLENWLAAKELLRHRHGRGADPRRHHAAREALPSLVNPAPTPSLHN